ncbi:MAG: ATP-binding protein [Burkholderiales bacterium]
MALTWLLAGGFEKAYVERAREHLRAEVRALADRVQTRLEGDAALAATAARAVALLGQEALRDASVWERLAASVGMGNMRSDIVGFGVVEHDPAGSLKVVRFETLGSVLALAPGADLALEPALAQALRRASARPGVTLSGQVAYPLGAAQGAAQTHGFALAVRVESANASLPERVVVLLVRTDLFFMSMFGGLPPAFDFKLIDRNGAPGPDMELHLHSSATQDVDGRQFHKVERVSSFGGRIWALSASAHERYAVEESAHAQLMLWIGGALVSLLAELLVLLLQRSRVRALALAGRMTADLEQSRARFERMVAGTRDGVWELDVESDEAYLSPRFMELLGSPAEAASRPGAWVVDHAHPEERSGALAEFRRAYRAGGVLDLVLRMRLEAGEYRWFRVRGRFFGTADGTRVAGSMSDIHDEKQARLREERQLQILELSPDMVVTADADGRPTYLNPAARTVFDPAGRMGTEELANAGLFARTHVNELPVESDGSIADFWSGETEITTPNGDRLPVSQVVLTHRDAGGAASFQSTVLRDISAVRLAEAELRRHRDHLAELVAERTAGLEAARADAERANRAKSEFLANMSHELRTPMHAINSFADFGMTKADTAPREKLRHYFSNVRLSGARLLELLNDLLDLAKLEAGRMILSRVEVQVDQLFAECAHEFEALAQARDLRIEVEIPIRAPSLECDPARILQVLRNLVSNAIKFSPAGSCIRLVASMGSDGLVELHCVDQGVGIPEGELETVFDKFVQSSKTKTGAGGTGLGLAICREIVRAHGGTIAAANRQAPHIGAIFTLRLPRSAQGADAGRETAADMEAAA